MNKDTSPKKLIIKAVKIKGNCPVYKLGDKIVIDGPVINLKKADKVCVHVLFSLGTFIIALRDGITPKSLGLTNEDNKKAYYQCLDPGPPYTDGGTVIFEVTPV